MDYVLRILWRAALWLTVIVVGLGACEMLIAMFFETITGVPQ